MFLHPVFNGSSSKIYTNPNPVRVWATRGSIHMISYCQHWWLPTTVTRFLISILQAVLLLLLARRLAYTKLFPVHSLRFSNHCFFWRPLHALPLNLPHCCIVFKRSHQTHILNHEATSSVEFNLVMRWLALALCYSQHPRMLVADHLLSGRVQPRKSPVEDRQRGGRDTCSWRDQPAGARRTHPLPVAVRKALGCDRWESVSSCLLRTVNFWAVPRSTCRCNTGSIPWWSRSLKRPLLGWNSCMWWCPWLLNLLEENYNA